MLRPSSNGTGAATAAPSALLAAALGYAEAGLRVFPCIPGGKRPATRGGLRAATTDPELITWWWTRSPAANIGGRTGGGIAVLDVDDAESLRALEARHGPLPPSPRVVTGGGGLHVYFAAEGVRNTVGLLAPGLDTRGESGYALLPPSRHESGRAYEWLDPLGETPLAPMPGWLVELLRRDRHGPARPASFWSVLAREGVAEGGRNDAAARLAGHLLGRGLAPELVYELLLSWNRERNSPPLSDGELGRVVLSIARREADKWRR
jgi:hypothetical protein